MVIKNTKLNKIPACCFYFAFHKNLAVTLEILRIAQTSILKWRFRRRSRRGFLNSLLLRQNPLLYLTTEMQFSIGRERITWRALKLCNSLGRKKLTNSPVIRTNFWARPLRFSMKFGNLSNFQVFFKSRPRQNLRLSSTKWWRNTATDTRQKLKVIIEFNYYCFVFEIFDL